MAGKLGVVLLGRYDISTSARVGGKKLQSRAGTPWYAGRCIGYKSMRLFLRSRCVPVILSTFPGLLEIQRGIPGKPYHLIVLLGS